MLAPYVDEAVALARRWADVTQREQTSDERATGDRLAGLLRSEAGLELAVSFVDRVARPEDPEVSARDLAKLDVAAARSFLKPRDLFLFGIGTRVAPLAPGVVVPIARRRLHQLLGHLVVDARDPGLAEHLAQARRDGYRVNVNLLGRPVLGENEAQARAARILELLSRDDVDYVSVSLSTVVSQISPWDTEGTVDRGLARLRPLFAAAKEKTPHGFINLDATEYHDLDLTIELFTRLLDDPAFHDLTAGIALQTYLPDALPALDYLIGYAKHRVAHGGAPIKIRLVKGANLAMERVEAALHGWVPASYDTKTEADANFLRCIERILRKDVAPAVRLGVGSHNLYDVALAHLLAQDRRVGHALDVEMLQGMAPAQARAVKEDVGSVLLYSSVVAPDDTDVAVSYLIRRLEENATKGNFLHALFSDRVSAQVSEGTIADPVADPMGDQEARFRRSVETMDTVTEGPRRTPDRPPVGDAFAVTPDSDPVLPETRAWAQDALAATPAPLTSPVLGSAGEVEEVVRRGRAAGEAWGARPASERAQILREAARRLEARRSELVTVLAAEAGMTIGEADREVSRAVGWARYDADAAEQLAAGTRPEQTRAGSAADRRTTDLGVDGARFTPAGLTLVTPSWREPVAGPAEGALAALAAGSAAVVRPAHPTPGCAELVVAALHDAGVPADAAQLVRTADRAVDQQLIAHPDVDLVRLTGSTDTARRFAAWRAARLAGTASPAADTAPTGPTHPGGPTVHGRLSGQNALVITPAADYDLAVADLVRSAFGYAGQHRDRAALAILVGSAATSETLRRQLVDAVRSIRVGDPTALGATMGPLIAEPDGPLLRALTTLEPGESWLVVPERLDDTGRLWSPGLKDGVSPGSFFHLTEICGPVLGLIRAHHLDEAITFQNATPYGLAGGLHSLDDGEIRRWLDRVEVGNAYVNRHLIDPIVGRTPLGGWKASVAGPGAQRGGPNDLAQLGTWTGDGLPATFAEPGRAPRAFLHAVLPLVELRTDRMWLRAAVGSDAHVWDVELSRDTELGGLAAESTTFRYRPASPVWVRTSPGGRLVDALRVVLAGLAVGVDVRVSLDLGTSAALRSLDGTNAEVSAALRVLAPHVDRAESDDAFLRRIELGQVTGRIRVVGDNPALVAELAAETVQTLAHPVLATGRRELLTVLREQTVTRTLHRYGQIPGPSKA